MNLKKADTEMGSIHIKENTDNYRMCLARNLKDTGVGDGSGRLGLYSVAIYTPHGVTTHYVLAEDEEWAITMARGAIRQATYQTAPHEEEHIHARAVRLPLIIRGWGTTTF
jgi:hypothetical protein